MTDDEQEHERLLKLFLFGNGDDRVRARFVIPDGRPRVRAELPALPATGRIVSVTEATPDRTAELHAIERAHAIEERALRYQRAALRERRHDGFDEFSA